MAAEGDGRGGGVTRFVVVASARTGSTFLVTLLRSHPDVMCFGEVFHPNAPGLGRRAEERLRAAGADRRDPAAFLEALYTHAVDEPHVGFKIFPTHDATAFARVLDDPQVRKIVLRRANPLAVFSSAMVARARQQHNFRRGEAVGDVRVAFNPRKFDNWRERYEQGYRTIDARLGAQEPFRLEYREVGDPAVHTRLLAFLGARPHALGSEVVKSGAADLLDRFTNPDAVRRHLEAAGEAAWLTEA